MIFKKCSCTKFRHMNCRCKIRSHRTEEGIRYSLDTSKSKHNHYDEKQLLQAAAAYDGHTECAEYEISVSGWVRC